MPFAAAEYEITLTVPCLSFIFSLYSKRHRPPATQIQTSLICLILESTMKLASSPDWILMVSECFSECACMCT